MPEIDVKIDKPRLAALRRDLKGIARGVEKVVVGAVNDTAKEVATSTKNPKSILKQITDKVRIKAGAVRKVIKLSRANKSHPSAAITLSETERLGLKDFGARQTKKGLSYRIEKAGARKKVPSGFLVAKLGGHAFKRLGKKRLPIRKLEGPSPWGVFMAAGGPAIAEADAAVRLEKNLDQRLQFVLLKAQGKI